jgi:tight adherence protein B
MLVTLAVAPLAAAASALVVQDVDTALYPELSVTLVVPPDAVGAPGETPSFFVSENGATIDEVAVELLDRERQPIDVVLLIDTSGSMKGRPLDDAKAAARLFVDTMAAEDRIAVVAFSSEPVVLQEFTADRVRLRTVIDSLSAAGETALYDGLVRAAALTGDSAATERYIVALSDGGDTLSINPADNAAQALTREGVPVYAVALESPEHDPATLETIARISGGRMIPVSESSGLAEVYASIAKQVQLRYRLTFVSTRPATAQLEIAIGVDSGNAIGDARVVVSNPIFVAGGERPPVPLERAVPSAVAFVAAVATAAAAVALVSTFAGLALRHDRAALEQLRYYDQVRAGARHDSGNIDATTSRGRLLGALGQVVERRGFTGLVQRHLESAGLPLRANEYIFFHVLFTIVAGLAAHIGFGGVWPLTLGVIALVTVGPIVVVNGKAARRRGLFEDQLPDILNLVAGSLRSGWGVQQALDLVVEEIGEPARVEFRRAQAEARLGMPLESALDRMAERLDSDDLRWTVAAISIQREVGGNLAEVLDTVARTIRERAELKRQVVALTADGRYSAIVLTALPFVILGMLLVVSTEYAMQLFNTTMGLAAISVGGVMLLIGIVWLRHVTKVEV